MRACASCGQAVPIRWRNSGPPPVVEHVAGPVISSVEYRRSCPGYIVDRRQTCTRCGIELRRGRWAVFFVEGEIVTQVGEQAPIFGGSRLSGAPCEDRATSPHRRSSVA